MYDPCPDCLRPRHACICTPCDVADDLPVFIALPADERVPQEPSSLDDYEY
jgi:hypothetical protein